MLKFIIIIFLLGFLFFRVIGFFFRLLLRSSVAKNYQNQYQQQRPQSKPPGANVNIDYVPDKEKKKNTLFKGGEYVDYEEVE